jgi:HSP20 family protein
VLRKIFAFLFASLIIFMNINFKEEEKMKVVPYRNGRNYYPMMSFFDNFRNPFGDEVENRDIQRSMPMDIVELDGKFILEASLPGFKKADINIAVEDNELIIEAKHEEKQEENKGNYCRCEIFRGNYRRVLSLSDNINKDKIDAVYTDGILSVSIPKQTPKPAHKIQVS